MFRMTPFHTYFAHFFGISGTPASFDVMHPLAAGLFAGVLIVLIFWTLAWKGFALWHSARNHQKAWFIVMLIVNSAGILEIIYLLWFRKNKNDVVTTTTTAHVSSASTPAAAE